MNEQPNIYKPDPRAEAYAQRIENFLDQICPINRQCDWCEAIVPKDQLGAEHLKDDALFFCAACARIRQDCRAHMTWLNKKD